LLTTRRRLVDQKDLSDHERKSLMILETVRRRAPIARADISRLINLNIVTVTSYVDQFLKKGILQEVGVDISTGGRKPTLVDLNGTIAFTIGVGLNAVSMIAVLCNLKGKCIYKVQSDRPIEAGEQLVDDMLNLVDRLVKESNVDLTKVHGVGIGFPGIVNRAANTVRWPSGLGGKDLSVSASLNERFQQRFGLPVILDNDANTAVFSEQWNSADLDVENAIYLYSGAGCGLMFRGHIYRGQSGSAGEWLFGHEEHAEEWVKASLESGGWYLDLGITHRAKEEIQNHPDSQISKLSEGDAKKINFKMIAKAAEEGDAFAVKLLTDAGTVLGRKAALLVNLLNPEMVIVGGGLEMCGLHLVDAVKQEIKRCSVPEATEKLNVTASQLGEDCVPLGAAAMIIQNYFIGS
jgi:N-acetylglucosamine repressor